MQAITLRELAFDRLAAAHRGRDAVAAELHQLAAHIQAVGPCTGHLPAVDRQVVEARLEQEAQAGAGIRISLHTVVIGGHQETVLINKEQKGIHVRRKEPGIDNPR